jgi:hypothetical protein
MEATSEVKMIKQIIKDIPTTIGTPNLKMENKQESTFNLLKGLLSLTSLLLLLSFLTIMYISFQKKKPIVILESDLYAKVIDLDRYQQADHLTIENFTSAFIRHLNLFDSFKLEEFAPIALNMMGPDLQRFYKDKVFTRERVQTIIDKGVNTKTTIKKIEFKKIEASVIPVNISFSRHLTYTLSPKTPVQKINFSGTLILQKLPKRTRDFPYGLKIISYEVNTL